ncbi:MAG: CHAD domain-containing protein [Planctomycetota bacterium]|nr:CHAD domain-containing protein [Planctomycetota bacterium]
MVETGCRSKAEAFLISHRVDETRSSRWLKGVRRSTTSGDAARVAIRTRWSELRGIAEAVAESEAREADEIRRLRVATRRAAAALRLFVGDGARGDGVRAARRRLKRLRRAAGAVRATDVHAGLLRRVAVECGDESTRLAAAWCIGRLTEQRGAAVAALRHELGAKGTRRLLKQGRALGEMAQGEGNAERPMSEVATGSLDEALAPLCRRMASSHLHAEALHDLRLDAKRLRYTLELTRCGFDRKRFDAAYGSLRSLQDALGAFNDLHELHDLVQGWVEEMESAGRVEDAALGPALRGLAAMIAHRREEEETEALRWLEQQWRREGLADLRRLAPGCTGGKSAKHREASTERLPGSAARLRREGDAEQ